MTQLSNLVFRSAIKGRFYSLVSVVGLSIAIAVVVLVSALVHHETGFESQYSASARIYRLNWVNSETGDQFATMFNPFAPAFAAETPEVRTAARFTTGELLLERPAVADTALLSRFELVAFADPQLFEIFDLPFAAGDPETALQAPHSLVLTRAAAENFFPGRQALGKTLQLESNITLTVTAVLEEMPATTHLPFHFIVPLETLRELYGGAGWLDNWGSDSLYQFLLLSQGADPSVVERKIADFLERNLPFDDWDVAIKMQPLPDIHFTPDLQNEIETTDTVLNISKVPRKRSDLLLFGVGALVLVLIASFNFMNLQIARIVSRNRQFGLLRVIGGNRRQVVFRVLAESLFFALASLLTALMWIELSLGAFGSLLAVSLGWSDLLQWPVVTFTLALCLGLGLVSGAWPAWMMAAQKPSRVLKGEFSGKFGARGIRQTLVLVQFAVSIVLIVVALGVFAQVRYSLSAPLGFAPAHTAIVPINRREVQGDFDTLRARILAHPEVSYISRGSTIPTRSLSDGSAMYAEGTEPSGAVGMRRVGTDFDYFEALGIPLAAGRSFQREFPTDESVYPSEAMPQSRMNIILNREAARRLGWSPEQAIGKVTRIEYQDSGLEFSLVMTIVGVTENVHYRSLRSEIVPLVFFKEARGGRMLIKTTGTDAPAVMAHIEQAWRETVPEIPLRLEWLDDAVRQMYGQETRIMKLLAGISVLSVLVSCLGLFAVASLVTGLRTREVGLRKVFGASVPEIIKLLSWQFMKPVLLASLFAIPAAWIYMSGWLEAFVYRVDLGPFYFLAPALGAVLIAWLTVAAQAWTVARQAPIHALRYE